MVSRQRFATASQATMRVRQVGTLAGLALLVIIVRFFHMICASPVFAECKGALLLLLLKWVKFGLPGHHLMGRHEDVVDSIIRGTVEGLVDDGMKEGVSTVQIAGPIAHDIV